MANVNKVILIGNVTRDPEVKFTSKGSAVTDIGLAINRNYTLDNGEKREETTFVDVELWGRLAEIAGEYAKKRPPGLHRRPPSYGYMGRQSQWAKAEPHEGGG